MKFLVTTKDSCVIDWSKHSEILINEAEHILTLLSRGVLRNIWFSEEKDAVLLFECGVIEEVSMIMNQRPLVSHELIKYEITSLLPYTGYERIINRVNIDN